VIRQAREAVNGDVRLAYEVVGRGEPVLLVQGLGYTRHGWGELPRLLAESFSVVSYDNRGVGQSDVPPGPYTVRALAEDALAVLDAAGIDNAHVVGASLGGMVAQELALAAPERVDRLVLACTTPGGARAYPLPERSLQVFAQFALLPPAEALLLAVKNSLADATVAGRPDLVEKVYRYRLENAPPLDGWQAQLAAGSTHDAHDRLRSIAAPTLVLTGTGDNVIDARNSELLADAIPGARLEYLEGTGHIFFWEEPERAAQVIRAFLEEAR
jgi:pimeloyl-ACP methyl ester carboxylesterase